MFQWQELGLNTLFMSDKATSKSCRSAIKSFHFTVMNFSHIINRKEEFFQILKLFKNDCTHYFPSVWPESKRNATAYWNLTLYIAFLVQLYQLTRFSFINWEQRQHWDRDIIYCLSLIESRPVPQIRPQSDTQQNIK